MKRLYFVWGLLVLICVVATQGEWFASPTARIVEIALGEWVHVFRRPPAQVAAAFLAGLPDFESPGQAPQGGRRMLLLRLKARALQHLILF